MLGRTGIDGNSMIGMLGYSVLGMLGNSVIGILGYSVLGIDGYTPNVKPIEGIVDGISILGIARVGKGDARFGSVGNGVGSFDADGKIKPNCATTGAANINNRARRICLILGPILFKLDR